MTERHHFLIADHHVELAFEPSPHNGMHLIGSFRPFRTSSDSQLPSPLFTLTIDDATQPLPRERRHRIRTFDTGNGDTIVDRTDEGGYQFIIKNLDGAECCLLIADQPFAHCRCALNGSDNMRRFGLNNALMLCYAFASAHKQTILVHASLVRKDGYGYAFTAKSGTGKSTQVSMWLRYLPGCDLMNDDNPIIRIIDGTPYIYGSPWSGKTPCYRNIRARLGAMTRIDRDTTNFVTRLQPIEAFATMLSGCSTMKWDERIHSACCDTVQQLVETTPIYSLHCLPNREAAEVCYKAVGVKASLKTAESEEGSAKSAERQAGEQPTGRKETGEDRHERPAPKPESLFHALVRHTLDGMGCVCRLMQPRHKAVQADSGRPAVQFQNDVLLPEVIKLLEQGHTVTLPLRGISMRPFLEDGRDKALLVKAEHPQVDDAVLAEISPRTYVLHRIWAIDGDAVTLLGDGNLSPEHCRLTDVKGQVVAFYRKGRTTPDRTDGRKWRTYSWLWRRLRPLRRALLAIYRRTQPTK